MTETYELASRTSVTYKTGEKYKESLINFSGDRQAVRADQIAYFGLDPEECESMTDFEVRQAADAIAQAVVAVTNKLAGKIAPKVAPSTESASVATPGIPAAVHEAMKNGDPWEQAGETTAAKVEAPAPSPLEVMLDTVNAQVEVKQLQLVWAQNKALFNENPELMAAYKAKGKSLQAAA